MIDVRTKDDGWKLANEINCQYFGCKVSCSDKKVEISIIPVQGRKKGKKMCTTYQSYELWHQLYSNPCQWEF
jgi:hypothetical protein